MDELRSFTIAKLRDGYENKEFTPEEIRREFVALAETKNEQLNAYLSVFEHEPYQEQSVSPDLLLYGIPMAIKDNILVKDTITTAGSRILENYVAAYDATAIARLKNAGASFIGKTNLDEFAMGSSTENSAFGPTKNPYDETRVPGGSSGGSTAAVAAGMAVCALGSETGGSVRQPAAFCGVVGLKPTYGRVSRSGLIAMASSLDQIGVIARTVEDTATVLGVIAGKDPYDATSADIAVPDYTRSLGQSIRGMKFGVPKEYFGDGLASNMRTEIERTIAQLEELGARHVDISLPHSPYALATYYLVMPSEASSNLARYDGIRYGMSRNENTLREVYSRSRTEGFGDEPRRRIMLGTYALSAGYYDAYYVKALKMRTRIKNDFDKAFKNVDFIVGPTTPSVPFKLGAKADDPLAMYLSDVYTAPMNLAGIPALSIPCGTAEEDGVKLPVGFQVIGKPFEEETILKVAYALEQHMRQE